MIRTQTPEQGIDRAATSWDLLVEARIELAMAVREGDLPSVRAWLQALENHAHLLQALDDVQLQQALSGDAPAVPVRETRRRDQAARTRARYYGFKLQKSAVTGGFRIVQQTTGQTVAGFDDDLSLDAVTDYFDALASED